MPKKAAEWSEAQVKRAAHSGTSDRHEVAAVGGVPGLCLQISPAGNKSWVFRYSAPGGRRREMGLGSYGPFNGLKQARAAAGAARSLLLEVPPRDPLEVRQSAVAVERAEAARRMTFEQAADAALAQRASSFTSEDAKAAWFAPLRVHVFPALGGRPVAAVVIADVVAVLEPIWLSKHRTATIVRARIESVLEWAIANEKRPGPNPAVWNDTLKHRLPAAGKDVTASEHRPAVQVPEVTRWYAALVVAPWPAARALQAVALTAARSIEARGMTWAELDEAEGVWTVPASRMKMREEHRVPISRQFAALIEAQRKAVYDGPHRGSPLIFPATRGGVLTDLMLSDVMKKLHLADLARAQKDGGSQGGGFFDKATGLPAVPHGLRSTFRVWCSEARVDDKVAERSLAHRESNAVVRAYDRADLLDIRAPVMQAWAELLTGELPKSVR